MKKRTSNENSIFEVIKEIIERNKLEPGLDNIHVKEAWKNVMGSGVNSYTQDVILKNTTLYVKLTSSVVREELSYGKTKIIAMLNENLGKEIIKELIFR